METMPLNEDALRVPFENWWSKHGEFVRAGGGEYEKCFAYAAFKAAYSPEVLQAMGVAVVPVKPTDDMVIAFAEEWYCQKQAIDDVKMDEAYKAMIAASPYAIKEQS